MELWNGMSRCAQAFVANPRVNGHIEDIGGIAHDALACWWLQKRARALEKIETILVLNDFGVKDPKYVTLQDHIDYIEECWLGHLINRTFSILFWSSARAGIENGTIVLCNAVPDLRSPIHYSTGMETLPVEIYQASVPFWLWPITQLENKSVNLLGNWALDEWHAGAGHTYTAALYLATHWPQYPITANEQVALANTIFCLRYHPFFGSKDPLQYLKHSFKG